MTARNISEEMQIHEENIWAAMNRLEEQTSKSSPLY
jgi:hypothetical protein